MHSPLSSPKYLALNLFSVLDEKIKNVWIFNVVIDLWFYGHLKKNQFQMDNLDKLINDVVFKLYAKFFSQILIGVTRKWKSEIHHLTCQILNTNIILLLFWMVYFGLVLKIKLNKKYLWISNHLVTSPWGTFSKALDMFLF